MLKTKLEGPSVWVGNPTIDFLLRDGDVLDYHEPGAKSHWTAEAEGITKKALRAQRRGRQHRGIRSYIGGGSADGAALSAHMGNRAVLVTVLGERDRVSKQVRNGLGQVGVQLEDVASRHFKPRVALNERQPGEDRMYRIRDASELRPDTRAAFLTRVGLVAANARFVAAASLPPDLTRSVFERVPEGIPRGLNPCTVHYRQKGAVRQFIEEGIVDVIAGNDIELSTAYGERDFSLDTLGKIAELASQDVEYVLITAGNKGVVLGNNGAHERYPAPFVPNYLIRDKSGAGDALFGGFMEGITSGIDPSDSVELGSYYAGLAIQSSGPHSYVLESA